MTDKAHLKIEEALDAIDKGHEITAERSATRVVLYRNNVILTHQHYTMLLCAYCGGRVNHFVHTGDELTPEQSDAFSALICCLVKKCICRTQEESVEKTQVSEPNICEHCGGQKTVYLKIEPCFSNNFTSAVLSVSNSTIRVCLCPPDQQKHDGSLDEEDTHHVYYNNFGGVGIGVDSNGIGLTAKEALSLRDWLIQESPTLQKLAKEKE